MKALTSSLAIAILVVTSAAGAGDSRHVQKHGHKNHAYTPKHDFYEYALVVESRPIFREVEVSTPVRECRDEPVYHTRHDGHDSAGAILAGGLIGGIIGQQFGRGRGKKVATAVGTLVGAKIGHDAVIDHASHYGETVSGYEEHCKIRHQVSYERVIDGYDVTYRYRGKRYHVEMPYDPGPRIKMRIQFAPVI